MLVCLALLSGRDRRKRIGMEEYLIGGIIMWVLIQTVLSELRWRSQDKINQHALEAIQSLLEGNIKNENEEVE